MGAFPWLVECWLQISRKGGGYIRMGIHTDGDGRQYVVLNPGPRGDELSEQCKWNTEPVGSRPAPNLSAGSRHATSRFDCLSKAKRRPTNEHAPASHDAETGSPQRNATITPTSTRRRPTTPATVPEMHSAAAPAPAPAEKAGVQDLSGSQPLVIPKPISLSTRRPAVRPRPTAV